jgi:hypothetical protein
MKYLVVCDGGNVRSVAVAFILKYHYNQEAIAAGRLHLSPATMHMLAEWADRIILMQPQMQSSIPTMFADKITVTDVGEDRWGVYVHPELLQLAQGIAFGLVGPNIIQLPGPVATPPPKQFGEV